MAVKNHNIEALIQCNLEALLELQRKYDELQADCKDLLSVIINLSRGEKAPIMLQFNDEYGFPSSCFELIMKHATWSKEPISKD